MAKLAIRGHATRGREIIELLEMLGGKNINNYEGNNTDSFYYIDNDNDIDNENDIDFYHLYTPTDNITFSLEEFLEKFPYKVGDKVKYKYDKNIYFIKKMYWEKDKVVYQLSDECYTDGSSHPDILIFDVESTNIQPYKEEVMEEQDNNVPFNTDDKGNISDGYHTFNELYEYRLLYNASMFNELAKQGLYNVHKSRRHSDGSIPFDNKNWFIVQAELPTGQISNHYEMKDWDLFDIPIKDKANPYDGHTPQDVAKRLREFLTPKSKYPTTYEECCKVLVVDPSRIIVLSNREGIIHEENKHCYEMYNLYQLLICRDAYWKIAGEQIGLGKPWEPDWKDCTKPKYTIHLHCDGHIFWQDVSHTEYRWLSFPTTEIRDTFYKNFKNLIEDCKVLL